MNSLDPRINRFNVLGEDTPVPLQENPDQLVTFEVFLQRRTNSAFEHVGIVHAPNSEMAFVLAKEQFSRRSTCSGLMVAETKEIMISPYTDQQENAYDKVKQHTYSVAEDQQNPELYTVFHLYKRGKQHQLVGSVEARSYNEAFLKAEEQYNDKEKPALNIWILKSKAIFSSDTGNQDIWDMLPEKKHRDVTSYKAKDRLEQFKAQKNKV